MRSKRGSSRRSRVVARQCKGGPLKGHRMHRGEQTAPSCQKRDIREACLFWCRRRTQRSLEQIRRARAGKVCNPQAVTCVIHRHVARRPQRQSRTPAPRLDTSYRQLDRTLASAFKGNSICFSTMRGAGCGVDLEQTDGSQLRRVVVQRR
jgi:hypothetical protein